MTAITDTVPSPEAMMDNGSKTRKKNELSTDDFLKLLLTQMRMQDPSKPFDNAQMLEQMSQLTSLTSSQELRKTIETLSTNMGHTQVLQASQLIGKKVAVFSPVSSFEKIGDSGTLQGSVMLKDPASAITIHIKDDSGKEIRTITKGASDKGIVDYSWDGLDNNGNKLSNYNDFYHVEAEATIDGKNTTVATAGNFKINSVALNPSDNSTILNVDGLGGIDIANILKIL